MAEVAGKDGLKEGSEDDLSAVGLRQSHPQNEDKLESVVKGEPVDGANGALEDVEEGVDDPVGKPLGIVDGVGGEEGVQGVVRRNGKADSIDEELGGNVEEDEEEVKSAEAEDNIDLGNRGLLLKVVEHLVLCELLIEL